MFEKTPLYNAALKVIQRIGQGKGFFVGGCIRDSLLGYPLKDIDIATELGPKQVMCLFPGAELIGADFGVVLVKMDGFSFEVTTFRKDGRYIDFRHPETVEFGTMQDDANRRDFTINALYYDPITEKIIDLVNGKRDLDDMTLRCVGDARQRFGEDALRILRAIRFGNRFGLIYDFDLLYAVKEFIFNLTKISAERVRDELTAILSQPKAEDAMYFMKEWGILEVLLPEVARLESCKQSPKHHCAEFTYRKKIYLDEEN